MCRYLRLAYRPEFSALLAVVATLLCLWLALYPREFEGYPPLTWQDLALPPLDAWDLGDDLAGAASILIFFYLFSLGAPFRRDVLQEEGRARSRLAARERVRLVGGWALLVLGAVALYLSQEDWFGDNLTFVVILAGYVGGLRVGLATGLACVAVVGTANMFIYGGLAEAIDTEGWIVVLPLWWENAPYEYVWSQEALGNLWLGLMAGLIGCHLGAKRWQPQVAVLVGAGLIVASVYLEAVNHELPIWGTEDLIARLLAVAAGLGVAVLIVGRVQTEAAQQRAVAAELGRTQAELQALRAQINPHFLFNSLNTIRYFVRTDPPTARQLLVDLSDVFQHALRAGEFVTLRDEVRYVEAYLALEQARLGERLQIEWALPPEAYLETPIPTLILQPLVENAVIHGITRKPSGGTLHISIDARADALEFVVADDGVGIDPLQTTPRLHKGHGIGTRNVAERLAALYGPGNGPHIQSAAGQGTTVSFRIPLDASAQGALPTPAIVASQPSIPAKGV